MIQKEKEKKAREKKDHERDEMRPEQVFNHVWDDDYKSFSVDTNNCVS